MALNNILLTIQKMFMLDSKMEIGEIVFTQFYELLPVSENEPPLQTINYDKKKIANEYTEIKALKEGAFPWRFPFGYAYMDE